MTKQGFKAHMGSNCVAPLLFTHELLPLLQAAVRTAPKDSVRVIWTGSSQIQMNAPQGGVDFALIEKPTTVEMQDYAAAKAANWFLAVEGPRRWGKDGIISVCQNPGNLNTAIFDVFGWLMLAIIRALFLYDAKYGAYTMLFSGFSPEVNEGTNGAYIWPFGQIKPPPRADVRRAKPRTFGSGAKDLGRSMFEVSFTGGGLPGNLRAQARKWLSMEFLLN